MSHAYCVARQFSGKLRPHSERVLGSSPGRVMGGGGVNDTCEVKAYDQMGTRTQDLWQTMQIL